MNSVLSNLEKQLLNEISVDIPEQMLDRFSTLIRESGSEDDVQEKKESFVMIPH